MCNLKIKPYLQLKIVAHVPIPLGPGSCCLKATTANPLAVSPILLLLNPVYSEQNGFSTLS